MIEFIFEDISKFPINNQNISNWVEQVVSLNNKIAGEVCFILCSDEYLLKINQQYLEHNYYTDVITFDYSESNVISGDIFISIDRVKENSDNYQSTFNIEILRIIIHGVLHLLGYNDKTDSDKTLMTSKEDECLKLYRDVE